MIGKGRKNKPIHLGSQRTQGGENRPPKRKVPVQHHVSILIGQAVIVAGGSRFGVGNRAAYVYEAIVTELVSFATTQTSAPVPDQSQSSTYYRRTAVQQSISRAAEGAAAGGDPGCVLRQVNEIAFQSPGAQC